MHAENVLSPQRAIDPSPLTSSLGGGRQISGSFCRAPLTLRPRAVRVIVRIFLHRSAVGYPSRLAVSSHNYMAAWQQSPDAWRSRRMTCKASRVAHLVSVASRRQACMPGHAPVRSPGQHISNASGWDGCALHAGKRSASQLLRSPLSPVCRVELRADPARHRRAQGCCLRTAELPIPISCA